MGHARDGLETATTEDSVGRGRRDHVAAAHRHPAPSHPTAVAGYVHPPRPGVLTGAAESRSLRRRGRHAGQGAWPSRLEADFPPERIFSATELERYAYCPYQFFLNKVLNVQPLEEVELEVDYMQRGQMAHELLAAFHRRVNQSGGGAESPVALAPADYERLLDEAIAETVSQPGRDSLADALREIDRRILLQWLEGYRQQHEKYDAQWKDCDRPPRPALFEISFGRPLREGDGPPSTAEPLELVSRDQVVRLAGRIDRIDVGEVHGQAVFNILDYKTGGGTRFSLEACQRGTALQLAALCLGRRRTDSQRSQRRALAGRILVPQRRRFQAAAGPANVRAGRGPLVAPARPGNRSAASWPTPSSGSSRPCGKASFPSGATTPTAPAAALTIPYAASTRFDPWTRHGGRRPHEARTETSERETTKYTKHTKGNRHGGRL